MKYYFLKDGEKELGPLTIEQLKSRSIKSDTCIWFAGLEEWTIAKEIHELRELFTKKPVTSGFSNNMFVKTCLKMIAKNPTKIQIYKVERKKRG